MNPIVIIIILANVLFSMKGFNDQQFFNKYKFQIKPIKEGDYLRMFTSAFLHVDMQHLLFNMLTLYFFADNIIASIGVTKFIIIYVGSLLFGDFFTLNYHKNKPYYSAVGASGAVMGVLYAAIMLFPDMKLGFFFIPIPIPGFIFGIGYLLYSIYGMKKSIGNVGHTAHIGGAIAGYVLTIAMVPNVLQSNMRMVILLAIPIVLLFIFEKKLKS